MRISEIYSLESFRLKLYKLIEQGADYKEIYQASIELDEIIENFLKTIEKVKRL